MKMIIMGLVLISASFAQAAQLDADVACTCASWVYGKSGDMELRRAHTGGSQSARLSA